VNDVVYPMQNLIMGKACTRRADRSTTHRPSNLFDATIPILAPALDVAPMSDEPRQDRCLGVVYEQYASSGD